MPNVRRPDRLSISLADKAARAITELTRENDWLAMKLHTMEIENRKLRAQVGNPMAANDDHQFRARRK